MKSEAQCNGTVLNAFVEGCVSFGCDANSCGSTASTGGNTAGATGTGGNTGGNTGGHTGGNTGGRNGADTTLPSVLIPVSAILISLLPQLFVR